MLSGGASQLNGLGEAARRILARSVRIGRPLGIAGLPEATATSAILLGTLKNYGLAGGLALALFPERAALPSVVAGTIMIPYVIWLHWRRRRSLPPANHSA